MSEQGKTVTTENGSETLVSAKPWYASKVTWVNILSTALFFMESTEVTNIIPAQYMEEFGAVLGLVNLGLRFFTNGPVTMSGSTAREINRKLAVFALCFVTLFTSACAMKGKPVERQIAVYGIQVTDGLQAVGNTAKELHSAKVINNEQYKAVLTRLQEAFKQSSRLADALAAYDAAAGPTTASQVKAALDTLAVLVPSVANVGGPGGEKIAEMISKVNQLLITISTGLSPSAKMEWNNLLKLVEFNRNVEIASEVN